MMTQIVLQQLMYFLPELVLTGTFCLILITGLIVRNKALSSTVLAVLGSFVAIVLSVAQVGNQISIFSDMIAVDPFAVFFKIFFITCTIIIVLFSQFSFEVKQTVKRISEYYALLITFTLGMSLMAASTNLLMTILAMELASFSAYLLAGFTKEAHDSSEASMKYILYGAIASGLMLYGASILFGLTGTLQYTSMNSVFQSGQVGIIPLALSLLLILAGFGYKISAVPFHSWTPDVYEGAPITVTTYLSVASKAAGFSMLIRFFVMIFVDSTSISSTQWASLVELDWQVLLAILSVLTMTLGNLVALWQDNLKRMLAYSSIAHAGYILIGVVAMSDKGLSAVLIYFVMYLLMNMGAFFVVMLVANKTGSEDIIEYKGLGYRSPLLASALTVFLVSLTGIPPTAGFIGKLYIFAAALDAKWFWLAIIGVLNSVVSLYYYARVVRNMYLRDPDAHTNPCVLSTSEKIILGLFFAGTLILGVYFGPIVEVAQASLSMVIP